MVNKFIELLKKLGILPADKEAELTKEIETLLASEKVDTGKIEELLKGAGGNVEVFKLLIEQNKSLTQAVKDLQTTLSAEASEREKIVKATQERAKADNEKKVADAVDEALKSGKITEAQKANYTNLFTANFDSTKAIVDGLPVSKQFESGKTKEGAAGAAQAAGDAKNLTVDRNALREAIKAGMDSGTKV